MLIRDLLIFDRVPSQMRALALGIGAAVLAGTAPAAAQSFEFGGFTIPKDIQRELRKHGIEVPDTSRQKARISVHEGKGGHEIRLRLYEDPVEGEPIEEPQAAEAAPRAPPATPPPAPPRETAPAQAPSPPPSAAAAAAAPAPEETRPAPVAEGPLGEWYVQDRSARIAITPCDGNRLCGKVAWSKTNERLGVEILQKMRPTGEKSWEGRILDPRSGKVYDSKMVMRNGDTLRVEGCVMGFLCGGETWTRAR